MADSDELKHIRLLNRFWKNHACEEYAETGDCMHKHPQEAKDYEFMLSAERIVVVKPGEPFELPGWDGPYTYDDLEHTK